MSICKYVLILSAFMCTAFPLNVLGDDSFEFDCNYNKNGIKKVYSTINKLKNNLAPECPICDTLKTIEFMRNKIKIISKSTFKYLILLNYLSVRYNDITKIEEGAFANLKKLRVINLDGNELKTLPENLFSQNTDLEYLYMAGNELENLPTRIFWNLRKLIVLTLNGNSLTKIDSQLFKNANNLYSISLAGNSLENDFNLNIRGILWKVNFDKNCKFGQGNIYMVYMNNRYEHGKFHECERLYSKYEFNCKYNKDRIDKSNSLITGLKNSLGPECPISKTLRLAEFKNNNITIITNADFENLNLLIYLSFQNNDITKIEEDAFVNLKSLKYLNLKKNELKTLPENLFSQSTKLYHLYLSNNKLDYLPTRIFWNLQSLGRIDLDSNSFIKIDSQLFKNANYHLYGIQLQGNPLENSFNLVINKKIRIINKSCRVERVYIFRTYEDTLRDQTLKECDIKTNA